MPIEAKELRLGNMVLIDGQECEVKAIDDQGINGSWGYDGMDYNYEYFTPYDHTLEGVPLTPEILEKCGFTLAKNEDGNLWYELEGSVFSFIEGNKNGYTEVFLDTNDKIRVKFLHQLQNLYFLLTGQELI